VSAGAATDCPNGAGKQFQITITNGGSITSGDVLDFGLIAASSGTNVQKKLQFGPTAGTYNNGRSKIEVASGAGFHAVAVSTAPTLIDMLPGSGTYYTFVDAGVFTVQYTSFTNMDENGIQLSNSGPFSILNSTFDYIGNGVVSTSTLFSLNGVTNSTITLTDVTYGNSRSNGTNYNYTISGSSTGLYWTNQQYSGVLAGDAHEQNDTGNHIVWASTTAPTTPLIMAVYQTSMTVTFGSVLGSQGYELDASTGAWSNSFTGNVSSITANGSAMTLSFNSAALLSNTTYFLRVGNIEGGATTYANTNPTSTSTLTVPLTTAQIYQVNYSSITVNWQALPASPSSALTLAHSRLPSRRAWP
jgi:hypothetical protein